MLCVKSKEPEIVIDYDPERLLQIVHNLLSNAINLTLSGGVDDLCRTLAMSQPQLHRKLTALTGKNASQFIRFFRLARAKELLQNKKMNVSEVAFAVGFDDPKYFSRVFKEEFGVAPGKI